MRLSTVASSELVRVTCINFPAEAQELLIRSHRFSDHREFQSVLEKEDFDAFWSFPSLTSQESDSLLLLDMLSFFFFFSWKGKLALFQMLATGGVGTICRNSTVISESHLQSGHQWSDQSHLGCFRYS